MPAISKIAVPVRKYKGGEVGVAGAEVVDGRPDAAVGEVIEGLVGAVDGEGCQLKDSTVSGTEEINRLRINAWSTPAMLTKGSGASIRAQRQTSVDSSAGAVLVNQAAQHVDSLH
jgi:hypothetical protein